MLIIKHRINTIKDIMNLPKKFGAEIDIRSFNNELIISHDPFNDGIKLEEWLKFYDHNFIIFNIKEEGIEFKLLKLINNLKITKYFFLDQSFPFFIKHINLFGNNSSIRISRYENIDKAIALKKYTKWLWLDYLNDFPLTKYQIKDLRKFNLKFCVVSPELVVDDNINKRITEIKNIFRESSVNIDAVCTKLPQMWEQVSQ